MKISILYNNGLEATLLYKYAQHRYPGSDIRATYFDIGEKNSQKIIDSLPVWADVRRIDWMQDDVAPTRKLPLNTFPGKEIVLAVNLAAIELPNEIWISDTDIEGTTPEVFTTKTNEVLKNICYTHRTPATVVKFPFIDAKYNLTQAISWCVSAGLPNDVIQSTNSCENSEEGHCGKCFSCLRRWSVFASLGIPCSFNTMPLNTRVGLDMAIGLVESELKISTKYDSVLRSETLPKIYEFIGVSSAQDALPFLQARRQLIKE